jgi:acyl carrier protein
MTRIDPDVLQGVLELLDELAGDWEYDGAIGLDTRFIADLGVESLEIVVLGSLLQQRYGTLPFARFLEEIGERPVDQRDLSVRELVEFVCEHRAPAPAEV